MTQIDRVFGGIAELPGHAHIKLLIQGSTLNHWAVLFLFQLVTCHLNSLILPVGHRPSFLGSVSTPSGLLKDMVHSGVGYPEWKFINQLFTNQQLSLSVSLSLFKESEHF